jgi:NDP-sugar pyrophosphorylase family protein/lipopolysaccharide/colanic/teichoic acid biosynthesis glycosyltransferase
MQVVLLATDEQTKLSPLSEAFAGPLLPVVNRPVMAYTIENLARSNIKNIIVCLFNRGGTIASYFGSGRAWGVQFDYVVQREAWGTAGALRWVAPRLTTTTLVLPADVFFDLDIQRVIEYHQKQRSNATIILNPKRSQSGGVLVDEQGVVLATNSEVPVNAGLQPTGAYVFEPHVLQTIPLQTSYDCLDQLIPKLRSAGETIHGYVTNDYWNPLTSMADYQAVQQEVLHSAYQQSLSLRSSEHVAPQIRFATIPGQQIAPGVWVGRNHNIHPNVSVAAPVYLGDNCHVGQGVELGPDAIIGSDVVVDDEATVVRSTILPQTYVGQVVQVADRIVYKNQMADVRTGLVTDVVDPFLLSEVRLQPTFRSSTQRFSVVIAMVLFCFLLPVLVVVGLVTALTNRGRILTRERYVGRRAAATGPALPETLMLVKFCTRRSDGTFTGFGKWLHNLEWDHLPSLWNVITGELAFVGVRPLRAVEAELLHETWHAKRYEAPAGLTGLWFIQTERQATLDDILVADAYYVATRTWFTDLRIAFATPFAWLRRMRQGPVPERVSMPVPNWNVVNTTTDQEV